MIFEIFIIFISKSNLLVLNLFKINNIVLLFFFQTDGKVLTVCSSKVLNMKTKTRTKSPIFLSVFFFFISIQCFFLQKCNDTPADTGVSKNPDVQSCPSVECDSPQHQYSSSLKVKDMTRTLEDVCYMTLASLTYPGTDFPALVFSFNTNVWFRGNVYSM